ncbi:MAG TPA: glycosyltransferase family 39 protein [Chloroflexota bacterium]|nr:glycosyltransferase family 39 protein [Chloroflexota bacterium]
MPAPASASADRPALGTILLLAIILGAWALRLYHLESQSIWVDEGFSWEVARGRLATILTTLATDDRHPPLHYVLLWATMRLAGSTEFALRFLSAGAAILAIPLVFVLGRRLGDNRVGLVASALLAISPFHVWYSQEARMYALLATLGLASWVLWLRLLDRPDRPTVVAYVLVTAGALYTHYFAVFILPAQVAAALLRPDQRLRWKKLLVAPAAALLLFSPWIFAIAAQASRAPRGVQPDLPLPDILAKLTGTYVAGEYAVLPAAIVGLAGVLAVLGVLPAINRVSDQDRLADTWFEGLVLAAWVLAAPIGAYLFTALVGIDVRASGRMYYLAGLPAFALLCARGLRFLDVAMRRASRRYHSLGLPLASVGGLVIALTLVDAPALRTQYLDIYKEDFRTAAASITGDLWPGDAIVLDAEYIWRPFDYYYRGAAPWFPASVEADQVDAALKRQTAGHDRVWLLLDHEDIADPEHRVQNWLDRHATTLDERWLRGLHLRLYGMEQRPRLDRPPADVAIAARFSNRAEVVGITSPASATGGALLHVTLVWHALSPFDVNDHAVLMLVDPAGQIRWQVDRIPISPWYLPKSWQPGEYLTDRYDVGIPVGLPPGIYSFRLKLYDPATGRPLPVGGGEEATLTPVQITPSIADSVQPGTDMLPGLRLLSAAAGPTRARPGDEIITTILWQSTGTFLPAHTVLLRLLDATGQVAVDREIIPIGGSHSIEEWQLKEVVEDREVLKLPARLPPGTYTVQVSGDSNRDAGSIVIEPIARTFDLPHPAHEQAATLSPAASGSKSVAELVGYTLDTATPRLGTATHLTLFWQARNETAIDYTVFTHLLGPDGRLAGQQDHQPAGGLRRTSSWLSGEFIQDEYDLLPAEGSPPGSYTIEVGMYRADNGERLVADGGHDAIILDTRIQVASSG